MVCTDCEPQSRLKRKQNIFLDFSISFPPPSPPPPVDPYVAAEGFLEANHLPSFYLDQVAEFIVQNAGEFSGHLSAAAGDPFTGTTVIIVTVLPVCISIE